MFPEITESDAEDGPVATLDEEPPPPIPKHPIKTLSARNRNITARLRIKAY
jgi:hypothetical protein